MTDTDANIIHLRCKRNGLVYRIVDYDKATNLATLQGMVGQVTEPYDPPRFKELGYERIVGRFEGMIEV
jgi:hypothetical protein